jgi:RNA polymerase sigma-70 factor (ECF subfamily)
MDLMAMARNGDDEAFAALVGPLRPELQLHCYRILGSLHDAEDALQETMLAAWKAFPKFEERSLRGWLYRIGTNRSLNMLRASYRRPRAAEPMHDVELPDPSRIGQVLWLEPYPDSLLEEIADDAPGPEARFESREATSLAFVTALQLLPPRQRAVLILRDVLGFRAAETAEMLESSEESVTSALKRARATLKASATEGDVPAPAPRSAAEQTLVERFVRAFESSDVRGVVSLLTDEVRFTMPPLPAVWQGRDRAGLFLDAMVAWSAQGHRVLQTRANGQPAVGIYVADPHGSLRHGVGLLVLTLAGERVSAITRFEPGLLERFGLPRTLLE